MESKTNTKGYLSASHENGAVFDPPKSSDSKLLFLLSHKTHPFFNVGEYSRYKFQSRIYLKVFTFFHPSLVDDFAGFLNEFDLFDVEDIPYDVLNNGFSALCIFPLDTDTIIKRQIN